MIKLKRMGVGGTELFKSQTFEFREGISYIYGLNKSTRIKTSNSNASGKSRFFGYLSEVLYDMPIIGLKQDRQKTGKRFLEYEYDGHEVKIMSSFASNGKEKVTIWFDGLQKTYLTPTKGKAEIAKVWKPSSDDFNTYVYLDSRVPHPLVRGSSIDRKNFFTSFFGLNRIDAERKVFAAELTALMKIKAAHAELKKSYEALHQDVLTKEQVLEFKASYTEKKAKYVRITARLAKAQEVRRLCDFVETSKAQVDSLRQDCDEEVTADSFENAVRDAKWHINNDTVDLEDARGWERYKEDRKEYDDALAKLGPDVGEAEDYAEGSRKYEKAIRKYEGLRAQLSAIPALEEPEEVAVPKGELDDLLVIQSNFSHSLEHARKFGSGKCHACGQDVAVKDPEVLSRKLQTVKARIAAHREYAIFQQELRDYEYSLSARQELDDQVAKYKRISLKYKSEYTTYQVLKDLVAPKPFKGKKLEVNVKERMLRESHALLQSLEFCRPHIDTIQAYDKLTEKELSLRDYDPPIHKLQEAMASIRARLEVHAAVKVRAADMKVRMAEMEEELVNEEPLRLLIKGYSDKAMKKMAIEAICSRLMGLVNHYGQMYFPGFEFEFLWGTQLSIIAHRPNGEASDVRKLSGAESLLFTLVLLMSLAAFVPSRKKVSVLILDEPSASFGAESTRVFHEMLPQLNKIFPSIVVITPKTEEQYPGAHNYTVVRHKEGARIEEGIHE